MTVRGGGVPCHAMAFVPPLRMGPPPRSSPPMRMRASWFGSLRSTGYKVAARVHRALTAPARVGFQHEWVGAKKRDSKSNKETGMKKVKNAVK